MIPPDHPLKQPLAERLQHTLPGRLAIFAHGWPERPAIREKWRGLWREYSWREYAVQARACAESLQALGLGAGDRVAIISDNRPEWMFADLGAQAIGALSAGIYTTNPAADVAYVLNHCRARVLIAEDQEQVDKVLASPEELPHLEKVVYLEAEGVSQYDDPRLVHWPDFVRDALQRLQAESLEPWHDTLAAIDPRQASVIIYTSGTTGKPKGVLLSPHNMLSLSSVYLEELGGSPDDTLLSYLPLCHIAEKIFSQLTPLTSGALVHFGESIDTVKQDLTEVSPTVFLGVPRIWEKLAAGVDVAIKNTSPEKRALYTWALAIGERAFDLEATGQPVPPGLRLQRRLAEVLVLRALRDRLGLARVRLAFSGAAPIAPELLRWLHAIGVPVMEGYGLSETGGISTINRLDNFRLGTVGQPATGVEVRLADDGEVLVRGDNIFLGYLDNEEATRETLDDEGWLHTGDIGSFDDEGFLRITGRKKEIFVTAGGKNIAPAKIENAMKTSPYIKEIAAIGDGRHFISALISIDGDMVGDWASRRGVAYTSYEDLTRKPEVHKLIDEEVRRINDEMLARVEQVRAFRLLPKELHQDDGEVTATQKLKRNVVEQKYAALVNEIYTQRAA